MDHPKLDSPLVTADCCAHLRHKGMYVMAPPDADAAAFYDPYEATSYWCACTQSGFGPDRAAATRHACAQGSGRKCCE